MEFLQRLQDLFFSFFWLALELVSVSSLVSLPLEALNIWPFCECCERRLSENWRQKREPMDWKLTFPAISVAIVTIVIGHPHQSVLMITAPSPFSKHEATNNKIVLHDHPLCPSPVGGRRQHNSVAESSSVMIDRFAKIHKCFHRLSKSIFAFFNGSLWLLHRL